MSAVLIKYQLLSTVVNSCQLFLLNVVNCCQPSDSRASDNHVALHRVWGSRDWRCDSCCRSCNRQIWSSSSHLRSWWTSLDHESSQILHLHWGSRSWFCLCHQPTILPPQITCDSNDRFVIQSQWKPWSHRLPKSLFSNARKHTLVGGLHFGIELIVAGDPWHAVNNWQNSKDKQWMKTKDMMDAVNIRSYDPTKSNWQQH